MPRCRTLAVALVAAAAALPSVAAEARPPAPFGQRNLGPGMHGHDVRVLQRYLTRVGLVTPVDGQYGPYTTGRVRSWERRSHRYPNGRLSRSDARLISRQVARGTRVHDPAQPVAAPAPAAPAGEKATLANGRAAAPAAAPASVKAVVAAANRIVGKPYKYGGGHARWEDSGYDCSGSMSYALHGGGLLSQPLTSSGFASWGRAGRGQWITTFGNGGHSYMVVAGLRFDTGWHNGGDGPRWSSQMRPATGYSNRHPAGL